MITTEFYYTINPKLSIADSRRKKKQRYDTIGNR